MYADSAIYRKIEEKLILPQIFPPNFFELYKTTDVMTDTR